MVKKESGSEDPLVIGDEDGDPGVLANGSSVSGVDGGCEDVDADLRSWCR